MTSQTVRVLTSFALLTLAGQPAGAQPAVSISGADRRTGSRCESVFQPFAPRITVPLGGSLHVPAPQVVSGRRH